MNKIAYTLGYKLAEEKTENKTPEKDTPLLEKSLIIRKATKRKPFGVSELDMTGPHGRGMVPGRGMQICKSASSSPDQYSTPEKFTQEELLAAVRQDIMAELDAINLYEAHIAATDDESLKSILKHISDEEREHVKELEEYLEKKDSH